MYITQKLSEILFRFCKKIHSYRSVAFSFCRQGFTIYVAHRVPKDDFGAFILLQSFVAGLSALLLTIPAAAFTRFYNRPGNSHRYLNEFRTYTILISALAFLFAVLIGLLGFNGLSLKDSLLIGSASTVIFSFSLRKSTIFLEIERGKTFYVALMEKIARFFVPLLVYFFFGGHQALMIDLVIGYIIVVIILGRMHNFGSFSFIVSFRRSRLYFKYMEHQ